MTEILIKEQCGSVGSIVAYAKSDRGRGLDQIKYTGKVTRTLQAMLSFFREVLLPYGYPDSVSEDYFSYQLWDTLQAFCSTITAGFTTRAILKGVGVGNAEASALSATITWIMKDGTGMMGRILFAWWKGSGLDSDCKKWRLFADLLNDVAMFMELFLPYLSNISMLILCTTTGMKSIVGIAGGATRASITHHQAIKDNMAEIAAKDGSQETLVNLVASFSSIFLLTMFDDTVSSWVFIITLMSLHLCANYMAVKSLVFKNFNTSRLVLLLSSYFNTGIVLDPHVINENESVVLGRGLKVRHICGLNIKLGDSLSNAFKQYNLSEIKALFELYLDKKYLLVSDVEHAKVYVYFEKGEMARDAIAAYFHAVCLAIASCIYNDIEMDTNFKRQLHHSTVSSRLGALMRPFSRPNEEVLSNIPFAVLHSLNKFVDQETEIFYTALQLKGWNIDSHSLEMGQWRTDWKFSSKKKI